MKSVILPHLYEIVAQEAMLGFVVFEVGTGDCLFINKMGNQLLGLDRPNLKSLIPAQERPHFKSFSVELLKHDGLYQDIIIDSFQAGPFVANVGIKFIEIEGQKAHLLMIQDVTLQKKLQREVIAKQNEIKSAFEELLVQNKQLKDLDVAKNRFIALTTHELRTPLSAMVSSAEILKLGLCDSEDQKKEFIEMIHDQGIQLQNLVNDILDYAKIQAGKMDFYIEQQSPLPLIQGLIRNFEGMAEGSSVTISIETPDNELHCYYDEMRMRQIISNIVSNAIKYNRSGGTVSVSFSETEEFVKVFVQDTGKGIASDQFEKVFNEFETLGQVSAHHSGTGLGMPISRRLMEAMGGKLMLDSIVEIGSTFWVEIPKTKVLADEMYRPRPSQSDDLAA